MSFLPTLEGVANIASGFMGGTAAQPDMGVLDGRQWVNETLSTGPFAVGTGASASAEPAASIGPDGSVSVGNTNIVPLALAGLVAIFLLRKK